MNMNKIIKLVTTVAVFMVMFAIGSKVSASEENNDLSQLPQLPEEVEFDLTNETDVQEYKFIDDKGQEVTVGLEPIADPVVEGIGTYATVPVGNKSFRIYWNTGVINMEYYITTNRVGTNARITSATGLAIFLIGYSEENRKFTYTSSRAEYTGTAKLFGKPALYSVPMRLTAVINGTTLTTSARA